MPRTPPTELLRAAKAALDPLELYPHPVRIDRVRIVVSPRLFRLPGLRRFAGYALRSTILLREHPAHDPSLLVHELCHIWQMQHHPIRMPLSYVTRGYRRNPYELEARRAAGHRPPAAR